MKQIKLRLLVSIKNLNPDAVNPQASSRGGALNVQASGRDDARQSELGAHELDLKARETQLMARQQLLEEQEGAVRAVLADTYNVSNPPSTEPAPGISCFAKRLTAVLKVHALSAQEADLLPSLSADTAHIITTLAVAWRQVKSRWQPPWGEMRRGRKTVSSYKIHRMFAFGRRLLKQDSCQSSEHKRPHTCHHERRSHASRGHGERRGRAPSQTTSGLMDSKLNLPFLVHRLKSLLLEIIP